MTGIELTGTTQERSRLGQLPSLCQRACLQQQVAQRIFAPFQRRQVVRLQGQDALEQGQRTAVAVIQASGRERVTRLRQQRTNTGSGATSRLQLAGDRIGVALRHLQLTGQCQGLRAAVQVIRLQAIARLLQRCRAGIGEALARLRAITVQRQRRLVALARTTAVGIAQAPSRQCTIPLGQQLFDLRLIPEPICQRLAQQDQQHEHGQRCEQRPAPDPARMARLQPPPTPLATDTVQRRMFSAMRAMRGLAFHACRVAGAA